MMSRRPSTGGGGIFSPVREMPAPTGIRNESSKAVASIHFPSGEIFGNHNDSVMPDVICVRLLPSALIQLSVT